MQGTVKFFAHARRYGFICIEGGLEFVFFADQIIGDPLEKGDEVEFWLDDPPAHSKHQDIPVAVEVKKVTMCAP